MLLRAERSRARRGAHDDAARRAHVRARLPAAAARRPRRRLPASTSCSARSTTSSTTGDPDAQARVAAVEAWCARRRRRPTREVARARRPRRAPPAAARRAARLLRRACATTSPASRSLTEDELDALLLPRGRHRRRRHGGAPRHRRPEPARPAAAALGMAMQRTNILRDIDEDLANGRVYLARETLERFGGRLDPGRRARRCCATRSRAPTRSTSSGCAGIPTAAHGRRAIAAAAAMYREILRQIEREGYGATPGPRRRPGPAQAADRGTQPRRGRAVPGDADRRGRSRALARGARALAGASSPTRACRAARQHRRTRGIVALMLATSVAEAGEARGPAARLGAARRSRAAVGFAAELVGVAHRAAVRPLRLLGASSARASAACRCWPRPPGR